MLVATESFKDSQAAAWQDPFFHPSSPEAEKAVGRVALGPLVFWVGAKKRR